MILGTVLNTTVKDIWDLPILLALMPHAMYITGGFLYFRGGQYRAREAMRTLTLNPKMAAVLYLRPFRSDATALRQTFLALFTFGDFNLLTHTECLADVLKPFGQMLMVGRPGEGLPRPGAASLYADNAEWQALVTEQMSDARLVVIRPGQSDGIMWELGSARRHVRPDRLLIELPGFSKRRYRELREQFATRGIHLPVKVKRRGGFIRFNQGWEPEYLPMTYPILRSGMFNIRRKWIHFTLRPVFESQGIPWDLPKIPIGTIFVFILLPLGLVLYYTIVPS